MKYSELFFWLSFSILFYTFIGYGILLWVLVKLKQLLKKKSSPDQDTYQPPVTLVIPCYNEAAIIPAKIRNSIELDYPAHLLTIIFITDGSTDHTAEVMKNYPSIKWLHEQKRAGKTAAENRVMKLVTTPVVVFSDANAMLNKEALQKMVRHFANEQVGCVSGEKRITGVTEADASTAGEGIYWRYESFLKKLDSELYSVVGAAGELVAFRTSLYTALPDDTLSDDFMQSMMIASAGKIIVYEPGAYAIETASLNIQEELKRKIRISAGGWQSMSRLHNQLRLSKNPLLYFQYFSHRVLRWAVTPWLLLIFFVQNLFLVLQGMHGYLVMLLLQLMFYSVAVAGYLLKDKKLKTQVFFVPYYFCVMNYAVIAGLFRFLAGTQKATWEKAQRQSSTD